jgi:5-methylcytosine-specific restriction endonuclease McrA
MCEKINRLTAANVVDHRIPHRGDQALFWDRSNWQSLCAPHHNSTKQRLEKSGRAGGCDINGLPLDHDRVERAA